MRLKQNLILGLVLHSKGYGKSDSMKEQEHKKNIQNATCIP